MNNIRLTLEQIQEKQKREAPRKAHYLVLMGYDPLDIARMTPRNICSLFEREVKLDLQTIPTEWLEEDIFQDMFVA